MESTESADAVVEKRVSWAELFFDLVFVFAVTEISAAIEHDHSWAGLLRAVVLFVPVYWLWVGTAIQTNRRDTASARFRLSIFVVALTAVFMALSIERAYEHLGLVFACAYLIGRTVLGGEQIISGMRSRSFHLNPISTSIVITGPLLIVGAFVHGSTRESIWAVAALIDLSTPTVFRRRLRGMHFDAGHLAERFGQFVLIAIGESVVAIGASARSAELTFGIGAAVVAAFALSCALWWVYFHFAADAVRHALATAQVQIDIARLVLSYGHLSFIASIMVVSVGMRESVVHPGDELSWGVTGLLFGGTALYLATFGFTRWSMFRLVSYTRLTTAVVVLAALPVAHLVPALAAIGGLAVIVAVLNTVELLNVERIGWRARLMRRSTPST